MPVDPKVKFHAAMKLFNQKEYSAALSHFSKLAIDLFLSGDKEALEEMKEAMLMTIASYKKIRNDAVAEIIVQAENLPEQFFLTMRHYMDNKTETDPAIVEQEISKEIPLGNPEVKANIFYEGELAFEENKAGRFKVAVVSAQGPREEMEDEHLVTELYLKREGTIQMFAVFDGHGGHNCAYYVKQKLPEFLQDELEKIPSYSNLEIYNALQRTFIKIDKSWSNLPFQSTELKDYSGTTATVSLIFGGDILWVANVGDSRTILAKGNVSIQLSEEAKATVEKYAREIYSRGGDIFNGRVINNIGSSLAMARSIGDIDHPSVSALPTIKRFDLSTLGKNKSFLILGCDGLWDVISPEMATEICQKAFDIKDAALKLEKAAFLCGTSDNVTVMVVALSSYQ